VQHHAQTPWAGARDNHQASGQRNLPSPPLSRSLNRSSSLRNAALGHLPPRMSDLKLELTEGRRSREPRGRYIFRARGGRETKRLVRDSPPSCPEPQRLVAGCPCRPQKARARRQDSCNPGFRHKVDSGCQRCRPEFAAAVRGLLYCCAEHRSASCAQPQLRSTNDGPMIRVGRLLIEVEDGDVAPRTGQWPAALARHRRRQRPVREGAPTGKRSHTST